MANDVLTAANATLDHALAFVSDLNQHSAAELQKLRDNRARYSNVVRQVSSLPTAQAQAATRATLTTWIHNQVAAENQWQDFTAKFADAKAKLKAFIQRVGLTPPSYLGQFEVGTVGVAVVAAAVAAAAVLVVISQRNAAQSKGLSDISDALALASAQNWTPEQTKQALEQIAKTSAPPPDPFGVTGILNAAVPVLGLYLLVKVLGNRKAA